METTEFYGLVQEASHADTTDSAEIASEAVFETLGETLTAGEAENVAAQLPSELAGHLEDVDHDGSGYDREAFVERVGEHLRETELDPDEAERYTQGVTDALAAALTQRELQDMKAQLGVEIHSLFEGVDIDREAV
ncbi:DUF2267 domain-containing protein [Halobacteria archaeon AArc-m2/3/4]|uniref:DUF2267 domain-containing protein n=1 Tax=Natronoglomus mannanivorans TaxID=2979990 RepID=A0ABT2QCL2_9EURY|nr:DUF2267 domain-containing protein [Halobacteria archaeon AArc-m2/3/4]